MAGNKTIPLTWEGGTVIGTATIDENGLIMGEITINREVEWGFDLVGGLSISAVDAPAELPEKKLRYTLAMGWPNGKDQPAEYKIFELNQETRAYEPYIVEVMDVHGKDKIVDYFHNHLPVEMV